MSRLAPPLWKATHTLMVRCAAKPRLEPRSPLVRGAACANELLRAASVPPRSPRGAARGRAAARAARRASRAARRWRSRARRWRSRTGCRSARGNRGCGNSSGRPCRCWGCGALAGGRPRRHIPRRRRAERDVVDAAGALAGGRQIGLDGDVQLGCRTAVAHLVDVDRVLAAVRLSGTRATGRMFDHVA